MSVVQCWILAFCFAQSIFSLIVLYTLVKTVGYMQKTIMDLLNDRLTRFKDSDKFK